MKIYKYYKEEIHSVDVLKTKERFVLKNPSMANRMPAFDYRTQFELPVCLTKKQALEEAQTELKSAIIEFENKKDATIKDLETVVKFLIDY